MDIRTIVTVNFEMDEETRGNLIKANDIICKLIDDYPCVPDDLISDLQTTSETIASIIRGEYRC